MGWEFAGVWADDGCATWQWVWRRITDDSGAVIEQSAPFASFEACMHDARSHGFEAGASADSASATR